jgi:3-dehydroquinate synthase
MHTISVELATNAYPVYLGRGLLSDQGLWRQHLGSGKVLVVSNDTVAPLYLEAVRAGLDGRADNVHIMPDGERHKTIETWHGIIDTLIGMQARRDATVVALGGGVVGDISGFAAACYMRGIRFIQAPTTLLAQVDASVGGKTGVNHVRGKNLVGAFHQPEAVIIDTSTLGTLDGREFAAGLAEVVKYGAIRDAGLFDWLESEASSIIAHEADALDRIIRCSVQNKAEVVAADEREAGLRALLNFGHSFGHAIEAETGFERFLHGEAVAIGMVVAAQLSETRRLCQPGAAARIAGLLDRFGLPVRIPEDISVPGLARALELDKKALASGIRLILLRGIGDAVVDADSSEAEIVGAMLCNQDGAGNN